MQISFLGIALVTLRNAAVCFIMCESSLKLFNHSIYHLKALTGFL